MKNLPIITILETVEQAYLEKNTEKLPSDMTKDLADMIREYFKDTHLSVIANSHSIDIEYIGTVDVKKTQLNKFKNGKRLYKFTHLEIPNHIYRENLSPQQAQDKANALMESIRIKKREHLLNLSKKLLDSGFSSYEIMDLAQDLSSSFVTIRDYMAQMEKGEN